MFIGQHDKQNMPNGIVRAVKGADVYEGQMTSDGLENGFGRKINGDGECDIGVWKNGKLTNYVKYYHNGRPMIEGQTKNYNMYF